MVRPPTVERAIGVDLPDVDAWSELMRRMLTSLEAVDAHPGAPQRPLLGRKLLLTTIVAAVIWFAIYLVVQSPWLSFRDS